MTETTNRTRGEFIFGLVFFLFQLSSVYGQRLQIFVAGCLMKIKFRLADWLCRVSWSMSRRMRSVRYWRLTLKLTIFFKLDVNQLQKAVEELPWVYQSSVRKRWPALLYVYVVEQTPCALWGDDRLLSIRGAIFKAPRDRLKKPLVQLSGPDDMAGMIWDQYQQFERVLALNGYHVTSVHMTNRHSWEIKLASGLKLILGRNEMLVKLQQFIDVYPQLENREMIDYIDLRYDTGVAVSWKQQEGSGDDQNPRQKSDSRT